MKRTFAGQYSRLLAVVCSVAMLLTWGGCAAAPDDVGTPSPPISVSAASPSASAAEMQESTTPASEPKSGEYAAACENIIFEQRAIVESGVDLSTVDKVYDHADVVLSVDVTAVSLAEYSGDGSFPQTTVTFNCVETLKGTAEGNMTFSMTGGVLPISRYLEHDKAAEKMLRDRQLTDEQKKNGFMRISVSKCPQLTEGGSYVVFLGKNTDGSLYMTGLNYGALAIKDGVMTDFEGKTYSAIG